MNPNELLHEGLQPYYCDQLSLELRNVLGVEGRDLLLEQLSLVQLTNLEESTAALDGL